MVAGTDPGRPGGDPVSCGPAAVWPGRKSRDAGIREETGTGGHHLGFRDAGRAAEEGRGRGGHLVGRHMGAGQVRTTAGEAVEDGPRGSRYGAIPVA